MTLPEFAAAMNGLTKEQVAQAMETLPTDALEWAVGFEALAHPASEKENRMGRDDHDDITKNFHGGDRYSEQANEKVAPHKASQRFLVLRIVMQYSPHGISSDAIEAITGMPHQSCGARMTELKCDGLIFKTGTGLTRLGCRCGLYAAREEVIAALQELEKEQQQNGKVR